MGGKVVSLNKYRDDFMGSLEQAITAYQSGEMGDGVLIWRSPAENSIHFNWFGRSEMRCIDILGLVEYVKADILRYIEENSQDVGGFYGIRN